MISIEKGGWKVSRRIGVGDREHVRAGLLQVGCINHDQAELQVKAALEAAKRLRKTLRVYVNCQRIDRLEPNLVHHLIYVTMGQARDHDFMDEFNITRPRFDWLLGRCDIVIERVGEGTQKDLADAIMQIWNEHGGRDGIHEFANRKTEEFLRERYPQFFGDEDRLWELYKE
jgi:hypothetical protein